MSGTVNFWNNRAKQLEGRTIVKARYLTEEEVGDLGWNLLVIVLELDDGTLLFPSMDDEGNNGGALFGQRGGEDVTFPVIRFRKD
jgi:hypothetical protein